MVRGTVASIGKNFLIIDVGKRHGIAKGMPVISERGLVGHILGVGTNWSKVLLIIDPSSSVAAMTQSERAPGVVSGRLGRDGNPTRGSGRRVRRRWDPGPPHLRDHRHGGRRRRRG